MSEERKLPYLSDEQAQEYLTHCQHALAILLGGTKVWEKLPVQFCKPENIGGYIEAGIKNPAFLNQNTIRNGAAVVHGLIENVAQEMETWAKENGREDLLITMGQKIETAIGAADS